jgi:endoglucanase
MTRPNPLLLGVTVAALALVALTSAPPAGATAEQTPIQGVAPSVTVSGNRLVDGAGKDLRLLGVDYGGVEGVCVQEGFQQGATDAQPGPVFDFQSGGSASTPGQPPGLPEAFLDAIASWRVNAVRIMVNEMCWLGRGRPGADPPTAPIPDAHYDAAAYRDAIVRLVDALHARGIVVMLTLGDNPCPYRWPDQDGGAMFHPPRQRVQPVRR